MNKQKGAEEILNERDENLKQFLKKIDQCIIIVNDKNTVIFANSAYLNLFEIPQKDIINKIFPYETTYNFVKESTLKSGKKLILEYKSFEIMLDNEKHKILYITNLNKKNSGQQDYFNKKLKKYEFIVDASTDFMTLVGKNYTYITVNKAYAKSMEKLHGSVIGKTVAEVWGEKVFLSDFKEEYDRAFMGEAHSNINWFVFGTLGKRCIQTNYYPYRQNGKITHCAVISNDVTELQRTNEELSSLADDLEKRVAVRTEEITITNNELKQELEYRSRIEQQVVQANEHVLNLLNSIKSIIISTDINLNIIDFNPTAEKVFKRKFQSVIGTPLIKCCEKWDHHLLLSGFEEATTKRNSIFLDDLKYTSNNDEIRILGLTITPIYDKETNIKGFIMYGADITDKRLLETQLRQAQKLESIGQLAAGIAHEINTPMQYISDNTKFLKDTAADLTIYHNHLEELLKQVKNENITAKIKDFKNKLDINYLIEELPSTIDETLEGISHVTKIVKSMKEFAHPGVNEKTKIDINKAIQSTITISKNEWKYFCNIETHFSDNLPFVSCLPGEFNQSLLNIIVNAAHAIEEQVKKDNEEKGNITISTKHLEDRVQISIRDSGGGIPDDIKDKIFDPFFTTKAVGKGTGQGLFISHKVIIEKLGGKFYFNSIIGKGTTFYIELPISE